MIHKNAATDFCHQEYFPEIDPTACIHPLAGVIGHVFIGKQVMVSPFASIRGDEGHPIFVGSQSNVQDGVVIHALQTEQKDATQIEENLVLDGKYAVYIGEKVSLAHQVQIHGPALIQDNTFVGMKSLVFKSEILRGCVIEPGCIIMGVTVPKKRYVPAGTVVKTKQDAEKLPEITEDYPLRNLNNEVVHVNTSLADGYNGIMDKISKS